ncbi:hypothetical protein P3L10_028437 [Capsicum annuum]
MPYTDEPKTDFKHFIRMGRDGVQGNVLYDHHPLLLNDDDHQRVCQILKVQIQGLDWSSDKKVEWDPDVERVFLPSGKTLVPEYAMRFVGGSSSKEDRRSVDEDLKHPYFLQSCSMAVNRLMFMVAVGFNAAARIYPGQWSAMFIGKRLQGVNRPVSKAQK